MIEYLESAVSWFLRKSFFAGYDPLDPISAKKCKDACLQKHDAISLYCENEKKKVIDVLYMKSREAHRTGNAILLAETTSYQDRLQNGLPKKYQHFLECGADIVFWNPTALEGRQYASDLSCLIRKLKAADPHQKIVIQAHCAAVEPSIAAATALDDPSISLILDRGYADTWSLARSFTILTHLPFVGRILRKYFSCDGTDHLKKFRGKILFIAPEEPSADQIVHWGGRNLTYEMHSHRKAHQITHDVFIKLGAASDHWSSWNTCEFYQITHELHKLRIIAENRLFAAAPRRERSRCNQICFPILNKAWC
ncbi:MAG: hypothetical protein JSS61_06690 [Verrucomicrobia bacterium]|nr:hypothetical protein [Verrucomicrobiota bacterium]